MQVIDNQEACIIGNAEYQLFMIPLQGWKNQLVVQPTGLHPESEKCAVIIAIDQFTAGEKMYITLQLWKKGKETFPPEELSLIDSIVVNENSLDIQLKDGEKKTIRF